MTRATDFQTRCQAAKTLHAPEAPGHLAQEGAGKRDRALFRVRRVPLPTRCKISRCVMEETNGRLLRRGVPCVKSGEAAGVRGRLLEAVHQVRHGSLQSPLERHRGKRALMDHRAKLGLRALQWRSIPARRLPAYLPRIAHSHCARSTIFGVARRRLSFS